MKPAPTLLAAAALGLAVAWPVGAAEPSVRAAEPVERPDSALQSRLESLVQGFHGSAGIYVRHLPSGRSAAVRSGETFPTASMIKVPILLAVFDRLERGELEYNQPVVYRSSDAYADDYIGGSLKDGATVYLNRAVWLMSSLSDNTSALQLTRLAGGAAAVNRWLEANGFPATRDNSREPSRRAEYERWGWGQTTPREMAELLVRIRQGRAVSAAAGEEMYRVLSRPFWDETALSQIPPTVKAAAKVGAVDHSRSEAVLVNAPSGDYVFCVATKDQADTTYADDNEGYRLIRAVSKALWETFEPGHPWTPAEGSRRYQKKD